MNNLSIFRIAIALIGVLASIAGLYTFITGKTLAPLMSQQEAKPGSIGLDLDLPYTDDGSKIKLIDLNPKASLIDRFLRAVISADLVYLKPLVHPTNGLRISLHAVDLDSDPVIRAYEILENKKYFFPIDYNDDEQHHQLSDYLRWQGRRAKAYGPPVFNDMLPKDNHFKLIGLR